MERLEEHPLHVALTRPALLCGVPMHLALALWVLAAEIQIALTGLAGLAWAAGIVGPLWVVARLLVARDYNAVGVWVLWANTALRGFDSALWGGASVAPLPVRPRSRPRGLVRVTANDPGPPAVAPRPAPIPAWARPIPREAAHA